MKTRGSIHTLEMPEQFDMFSAGEADSLPAWLDPERVVGVTVGLEVDRDHVGEQEIGKLGNNREVWVVRVLGDGGEVLKAESFDGTRRNAAADRADELRGMISGNCQARLF